MHRARRRPSRSGRKEADVLALLVGTGCLLIVGAMVALAVVLLRSQSRD